jgi:RHS repeat-associated protein
MTAMPHLSSMFWDFHNQLKQANLNGHGTAYYVYAADGQRVRKVVEKNGGALIEERITLGGFEVFRRRKATGSISLERQTLHVMDDRERIALIETRTQGEQLNVPAQGIRYQFGNHLGSAVLELDEDGRMISYEEYYPYGSTSYQAGRSAAEVSLKRFRFTGMERDEETGLNHHGARYYAPWLARWTSADPVGLRGGINHYEYGKCCPTAFIDRAGTEPHKQLTLAEQKKFEITPVATRTGRGITKSQHKALRGIQDAFGPKGQMHWGHPSDNTHGTTRAGASPPLRPQPASENMSLGGGADKVAKQAARSRGEFTRNAAGVDTTVSADAKYKQPPPRSFEKPMGDYEESIARRTPPAQVPRAPTSSAPSSAPPHEQLELPFNKPPAPKAAPVAPVPQSSPLKTGLKAGATAAASIVIFLGLNYLVHKELQAQLDRDLTTIRSGARPMAEHAKARDPDQPVYFRFQVESRDSSYFIPFAGWLPNPPELHVIQFALSSTPVAPVTTVDNHLSFWHASTTTRVTYTELAIP